MFWCKGVTYKFTLTQCLWFRFDPCVCMCLDVFIKTHTRINLILYFAPRAVFWGARFYIPFLYALHLNYTNTHTHTVLISYINPYRSIYTWRCVVDRLQEYLKKKCKYFFLIRVFEILKNSISYFVFELSLTFLL